MALISSFVQCLTVQKGPSRSKQLSLCPCKADRQPAALSAAQHTTTQSQQRRQQQPQQQHYTAVDANSSYAIFHPPVVDIANVLAGQAPTQQQIRQVRQECESTGFLAITGHGITDQQLQQLFDAATQLFDQPFDVKSQLTVKEMQAGRGYEISPEHKAYMQEFQQQYQHTSNTAGNTACSTSGHTADSTADCTADTKSGHTADSTVDPSALQGILSERFCCGPDLTPKQQQDPYYSSDLGQVFFPANCWPTETVPQLRPQMLRCYSQCEVIAASLMQLLAVALGVPQHYFDDKLLRHHSNMQVANYPSQLLDPGSSNMRKKAHIDSGTLTVLASQDWLPSSTWQAGQGGLQLLDRQQQWLEVQVPPGALLVNLGSLMTRWTNNTWTSTLHRVTNPPPHRQHNSRRLSMAFFHKPAYEAWVEVLPTCYSSGRGGLGRAMSTHADSIHSSSSAAVSDSSTFSSSSISSGESSNGSGSSGISSGGSSSGSSSSSSSSGSRQQLPDAPLYQPTLVGDLTRQGILHKFRHLPAEEASQAYHAYLAGLRAVPQ